MLQLLQPLASLPLYLMNSDQDECIAGDGLAPTVDCPETRDRMVKGVKAGGINIAFLCVCLDSGEAGAGGKGGNAGLLSLRLLGLNAAQAVLPSEFNRLPATQPPNQCV